MPLDWGPCWDQALTVPYFLAAILTFLPLLACLFWRLEMSKGQKKTATGPVMAMLLVYVCCPLLFFSVLYFLSGLYQARVECRMRQDGRLTETGVVREKVVREVEYGENGGKIPHYWLLLEFRDQDGTPHEAEREVDQPSWNRYAPGSRLPDVEYLRHDPASWRFAAEAGLWSRQLILALCMAIAVLALRLLAGFLLRCAWDRHASAAASGADAATTGQKIRRVLWLLLILAVVVWGLSGLVFFVVGLLSLFVDLGGFSPNWSGEPVRTSGGRIAFTFASAAMVAVSAFFYWLAARQRYVAAAVVFLASWVLFCVAGWLSGISSIGVTGAHGGVSVGAVRLVR
jgi:hypothetical protein